MRSSYQKTDVELLLKDITGLVRPQPTMERERLIQSGRHYCEMLPIEYVPSSKYMEVYEKALNHFSAPTAMAVGRLAERIVQKRGRDVVLVSLARAGIPIGILLKRYIHYKYSVDVKHYAISIIRDRGMDQNAMNYLLKRFEAEKLQFVDGWIGKGAILKELKKNLREFHGVSHEIAVLSDPACETELCGTHKDILIPSACLNCTVSGLISRTFLRSDIIGKTDFHGAIYYEELATSDLSYAFIESIEKHFRLEYPKEKPPLSSRGIDEVTDIAREYGIRDIHLIKPGIGETTRVLLRRVPWKILIDRRYKDQPEMEHILQLAKEKEVSVEYHPFRHYRACGIIKNLADT